MIDSAPVRPVPASPADASRPARLTDPLNRRDTNFDFLRFALAALVVLCHSYVIVTGAVDSVEPLCLASRGQLSLGTLAVNYFFILSGFLVTLSWNNSAGPLDYLRKRLLRLVPAFLVVSTLCLLLFGPLGAGAHRGEYFRQIHPRHFVSHLFQLATPGTPATFVNNPIPDDVDSSLWTIRYEFQCYLLLPLLALLGVFRRRFLPLAVFLGAFTLQAVQYYGHVYLHDWQEIHGIGKPDFWPRFVTYFTAGMCFYIYRDAIPRARALALLSAAALAASVYWGHALVLTQPVFGAYLILYIAYSRSLNFHGFGRYGDFSYGVYLYAWPLQQFLEQKLPAARHPLSLFLLALPLSVVFAAASWHGIEKPCLGLKRGGLRRRSLL